MKRRAFLAVLGLAGLVPAVARRSTPPETWSPQVGRMPSPSRFQFQGFAWRNKPLAHGRLYVFAAGSQSPAPTYADRALTQPNPHPVVLDAHGRVPVWLVPGLQYRLALYDQSGRVQVIIDHVQG